jgi:hypothetical protein
MGASRPVLDVFEFISSAIHAAKGNAGFRNRPRVRQCDYGPTLPWVHHARFSQAHNGSPAVGPAAQFHFISFDRFQFALPAEWNAIILGAKADIDPVGVGLRLIVCVAIYAALDQTQSSSLAIELPCVGAGRKKPIINDTP